MQVRARVAGILERQLYNEGDAVPASAPLFRIERAPFEIELQQARAVLAQEAARRDLAQQEAERLKGWSSAAPSARRKPTRRPRRCSRPRPRCRSRARVRQAELNLSYTEVNAPIGGITGRARSRWAAWCRRTPIPRCSPRSRAATRSGCASRFRKRSSRACAFGGHKVQVELADGKAYPEAGKLNFAGSTVDAATGTVQMRAELPNRRPCCSPGSTCACTCRPARSRPSSCRRPRWRRTKPGASSGCSPTASSALQRQVRTGNWLGSDWVVLDGLKTGDRVIVDNLVRLPWHRRSAEMSKREMRFFIHRPVFAGVIAIVIVLAGLLSAKLLAVAQYPEIAPPTVLVTTAYPGASAETLARTVAAPIEEQLSGVEKLSYFSSTSSSNGNLQITVTFEPGTNVDAASSRSTTACSARCRACPTRCAATA